MAYGAFKRWCEKLCVRVRRWIPKSVIFGSDECSPIVFGNTGRETTRSEPDIDREGSGARGERDENRIKMYTPLTVNT